MEIPSKKIGSMNYFPIRWKTPYTNMLVTGGIGTGKTEFLKGLIDQDYLNRHSVIVVEPSGFLARDCYSLSKGKALYCSLKTPLSLNPMAQPYDPNQIVDNVAEAINQVITMTSSNLELTTRMKTMLDEAIKYCLNRNRKTLISVRDRIAEHKDDTTKEGLLARLNHLLADERMKEILCGTESIEWGKLISQGKSLILDSFGMGREKMVFAGTLISAGIKNYFRYERPSTYQPASLYLDEAHNYLSPNMFDILKEGRKFKISCVMATQDFALISERLVKVLLNLGTLVSFRVGHEVASKMAREMGLSADVLQFLEKYHFAYLSQGERGIAKAARPVFVKPIPVVTKKVNKEPQRGWFPLKPLAS
jgi:hypothetical protein